MKIGFEAWVLTSARQVLRVDQALKERGKNVRSRVVLPDFFYLADRMGSVAAATDTAVDIVPTGVIESSGMLKGYGVDAFDHALSVIAKEYCAAYADGNARFLMVLENDYYDTRTFVFPGNVDLIGEREFFDWVENIQDCD